MLESSQMMHVAYYDDSEETELMRAGVVPEELEYMSGEERKKILEAAGLNPEEYDF